jgi:hypothetical protein
MAKADRYHLRFNSSLSFLKLERVSLQFAAIVLLSQVLQIGTLRVRKCIRDLSQAAALLYVAESSRLKSNRKMWTKNGKT